MADDKHTVDKVDAASDDTLDAALEALGFRVMTRSRGVVSWVAGVNRYLEFTLRDEGESLVVTWRCDLGEFMLARGWQIGGAETTFQELYPQRDVRIPATIEAVEAEIRRTLGQLQIDLGDPAL
ncbi:MAG: hypothetical protein ACI970_001490 [Myxococcota bacterium]